MLNILYRMCIPIDRTVNQYRKCILVDRIVILFKLLGGEVYHYSTKLMMKEPLIGGRQEWHQDYG